MKHLLIALALLALSSLNPQLSSAFAQGTAFTYQGRLNDGANPANGIYDLRFTIYDLATNGTLIAGPVTNSATGVSNGLFTVMLDFGATPFTGATNWLEIGVETNGGGNFATLTPRQQLTPAPYAIFAEGANAAGLSGTIPMASLSGTYGAAVNLTNAGNSFSGNGAGLTGVNAAALNGLNATNFWQTAGNAGTSPTNGNFLGTTDNQPLELRAGGLRALRLEPDPRPVPVADNLIGGFTNNLIEQPGSGADFIGSGGYPAGPNVVHSNSAGVFIGAGSANQIGPSVNDAFIGAGYGNIIQAPDTVIGGGWYNTIQSNATYSTIAGGIYNAIQNGAFYSTIGGGDFGNIGSPYATISGGGLNSIGTNSNSGTISGGYSHTIKNNTYDATIGGGSYHTIGTNSYYSTIAGGRINSIGDNATASTIGGGYENTVASSAAYATVPGGYYNSAAGQYSFAAGNQAQANHAGAFVWADASTNSGFASTISNQFNVRAMGGVRFVTGGAGMTVDDQAIGSGALGNYVFAYSLALQSVTTPSTFQDATFNNDVQLNGWTHTPGLSQYFCTQTGLYLIQYTAEAYISDSMSMRGALNFIEIPGSQAYASPINFGPTVVISKSFLASVNSGNFLTIQFTGNSASDHLQGGGSGSFQPSISLTITRIQ